MDEQPKKSALDDYFSSMLRMPVSEPVDIEETMTAETTTTVDESLLVEEFLSVESSAVVEELDLDESAVSVDDLVSSSETYVHEPVQEPFQQPLQENTFVEFAEPEIAESPRQDLDQLLETVVDIDIDELALLDIDMSDLSNELTHSQDIQDEVDNAIEQLISAEQNTAVQTTEVVADEVEPEIEQVADATAAVSAEELDKIPPQPPEWKNIELENQFQALFFEVAGVTFAVPLTELGGIYQTDNINALFGKPDWFLGMMQHRDEKFSVVDTVKWVMPEQDLGEIDYKYQIRLSESNWVLGSEVLLGNETLTQSDIKWRSTAGTRPWLAGMVKSRMCVLLHVTEMIKLLDNGINIQGQ